MSSQEHAGRSTDKCTDLWGESVVTIADNVGQGADQDCSHCKVWCPSGNTGTIQIANTTATANDATLVNDVVYDIPVSNTNKLYFYGATNGDKVYIMWFD